MWVCMSIVTSEDYLDHIYWLLTNQNKSLIPNSNHIIETTAQYSAIQSPHKSSGPNSSLPPSAYKLSLKHRRQQQQQRSTNGKKEAKRERDEQRTKEETSACVNWQINKERERGAGEPTRALKEGRRKKELDCRADSCTLQRAKRARVCCESPFHGRRCLSLRIAPRRGRADDFIFIPRCGCLSSSGGCKEREVDFFHRDGDRVEIDEKFWFYWAFMQGR